MSENQPVKTDTGSSPVSLRQQPQRHGAREPEKKHTTVKSGGEKHEKDFETEKALGKSVDCGKRAYKKKIFVVLAACRLPRRRKDAAKSGKASGEKKALTAENGHIRKKIFVVLTVRRLPRGGKGTARQKSAKKKNGASDVKHIGHAAENQAV